jgi:hypothetical protein
MLENHRSIVSSWIYDCIAYVTSQAHVLDQLIRYMARHLDDPYVNQRAIEHLTSYLNVSGFTDVSLSDKSDKLAIAMKGAVHY